MTLKDLKTEIQPYKNTLVIYDDKIVRLVEVLNI